MGEAKRNFCDCSKTWIDETMEFHNAPVVVLWAVSLFLFSFWDLLFLFDVNYVYLQVVINLQNESISFFPSPLKLGQEEVDFFFSKETIKYGGNMWVCKRTPLSLSLSLSLFLYQTTKRLGFRIQGHFWILKKLNEIKWKRSGSNVLIAEVFLIFQYCRFEQKSSL